MFNGKRLHLAGLARAGHALSARLAGRPAQQAPGTGGGAGAVAGGVHVDSAHLASLEVAARDFHFKPRQPVHSVLAGRHASRVRGRGPG